MIMMMRSKVVWSVDIDGSEIRSVRMIRRFLAKIWSVDASGLDKLVQASKYRGNNNYDDYEFSALLCHACISSCV